MRGRINWVEGRTFVAESGSGHGLVIDGPASVGGRELGPSPMELVLLGAGGCSAFDVVEILQKAREAVSGCEVQLEAERSESIPRVFTTIHLHFRVSGEGLTPQKVERAVKLSAEKYCSVTTMLSHSAEIRHTFEITEK